MNPAPARILMTADTVGGIWNYALELARALGEHSVHVSLATMGAPLSPKQRAEARRIGNLECHESAYKLEWMPEPWQDVQRAGDWLLELEQKIRPDLIHLNSLVHGALPWQAPAMVVGHSCVLSWWRAVNGCCAPPEWNTYRQAATKGLRLAKLVTAPSQAMLAALQTEYGPFRAGDVVANGRRPSIVALRKDTFIFSAGRLWDRAKNISTLAQVAPHLPWPVYVAGENRNPEGETIDHPHVRQLGHLSRNQLLYWFGHASIYALPARYEPFGLSALEAGLAGCALVLGDIPSLREIWDGAAMFVPPNDAEALKQALVKLIVDRDLRTELGRTARRTAERYTPAKMAEGYLRAYAKLIEKSGTTRTFNIQHPASNIQLESDGTGFVEPSADCQPAIRQTDSLRYTGRAACAS